MSFKKITLLGNVGAAPEIKQLPSGMFVANLSIATNEKFVSKGENVEKTHWWRVDVMQKGDRGLVTEVVKKFVHKGSQIMVEGTPQQEEWVDKQGARQRGFKIRIGQPGSTLQLCGKPGASQSGEASGPARTDQAASAPGTGDDDDSIPF